MDFQTLITGTRFEHSRQVARISGILARGMGYSAEETAVITQAAAYHDVGKVFIPKAIMDKPGPLTPEEYEVVKTHTELGYREIMNTIAILRVAAAMCRDHHEWVDGIGGYVGRRGLHPYVRLVSAADVADALLAERVYKPRWAWEKVLAYMQAGAGTQFDAAVVAQLAASRADILALYPQA